MSATPYGLLIKPAQADLRQNLRQLAADTGWTIAALCREADLSYSKVMQALSCYRWFLREEVTALAAAFEISRDELMGDSVFKEQARDSEFDKPMPWEVEVGVSFGTGRALCCTCGALRRFRRDEVGDGRRVLDLEDDPTGHRMVLQLKCGICDRETTHAELRADVEHRDVAEQRQAEPTREQAARQKLDALVRRLAQFNVDIHFLPLGWWGQKKEYGLRYEFDESKGQWRVDVDSNYPIRLQLLLLQGTWDDHIAPNKHGGLDPVDGVWIGPSAVGWGSAVDDGVADFERAVPVERQKMRLAVVDEVVSADAGEVSR